MYPSTKKGEDILGRSDGSIIPSHFKSMCPFIKCFYCYQYGHMKRNFHQRMIEYVFHRVKENNKRKKRKMRQNEIKRKEKE